VSARIHAFIVVLGAIAVAAFNGSSPGAVASGNSRGGSACNHAPAPRLVSTESRGSAIESGAIVGSMSVDPRVDIGHVHLKVSDLERSLAFYRDVLGFDVMQRNGDQAAFLSAGGYHHHIGLNTWESRGGSPPPPGTTGLYHTAIRYPDRRTLADTLRRLVEARWPIDGATDHGVSEAIYLRDPDGNGVELYRDRPEEEWPRPESGPGVAMYNAPFDLQALLAEAG
jgi:catechol 2,3-dioxygenase